MGGSQLMLRGILDRTVVQKIQHAQIQYHTADDGSSFMYVFFFLVVISAEFLGWAPNIRIYQMVVYLAVFFLLLEFSRLLESLLNILFRFYTTLVAYVLLQVFSREAHILLSVLFYCSTLIIFLQSGIPHLQIHVMVYILLFLSAQSFTVMFMTWFYRDISGEDSKWGRVLDPRIDVAQEIAFLVLMALLGIMFLVMEKYVRVYTKHLLNRSEHVKKLEKVKKELQEEIKRLECLTHVDLDSPLTKIVNDLNAMSEESSIDSTTKQQLESVCKVLTSNKLYMPSINFKKTDVLQSVNYFITKGGLADVQPYVDSVF
eukprot:m51a1_g3441 putative camp-specific phosphodiesterase (316) ;mRNA; r:656575-658251